MEIAISNKELLRHIIIWLLLIIFIGVIDPFTGSMLVVILGPFLVIVNYIIAFYIIVFLLLSKFWDRSRLLFIVGLIFYFLVFGLIDVVNFHNLLPAMGFDIIYGNEDILTTLNASLTMYILLILQASGYYYHKVSLTKARINNEKEKELLLREKIIMENEQMNLKKELQFLKNQFSSHITFNFLNYIYSHVYDKSEKGAYAIENFSNILRYSLKLKPGEKVVLKKEIEYIENFINLQKILSKNVQVHFQYNDAIQEIKVLPYILISLVENAFKHGKINDIANPIEIILAAQNGFVEFSVTNKKNKSRKYNNTGVGTGNIKQMLDIYYQERHTLEVSETEDKYSSKLRLYD